jgi:glycerol-3-phosphate dehydrogenase
MLGLMLVAGGKLTTYRVMAADVVDRAVRRLGGAAPASRTDQLPLLGADGYERTWQQRTTIARRHEISTGVVEHLLERYGTTAIELLNSITAQPALGAPVRGAPDYVAAEIAYAASAEGALHLADALARRTRISFETVHRGNDSALHAAKLMGAVLGWDADRRRREVAHYLALVEAERESQRMPSDVAADAVLTSAAPRSGDPAS